MSSTIIRATVQNSSRDRTMRTCSAGPFSSSRILSPDPTRDNGAGTTSRGDVSGGGTPPGRGAGRLPAIPPRPLAVRPGWFGRQVTEERAGARHCQPPPASAILRQAAGLTATVDSRCAPSTMSASPAIGMTMVIHMQTTEPTGSVQPTDRMLAHDSLYVAAPITAPSSPSSFCARRSSSSPGPRCSRSRGSTPSRSLE